MEIIQVIASLLLVPIVGLWLHIAITSRLKAISSRITELEKALNATFATVARFDERFASAREDRQRLDHGMTGLTREVAGLRSRVDRCPNCPGPGDGRLSQLTGT